MFLVEGVAVAFKNICVLSIVFYSLLASRSISLNVMGSSIRPAPRCSIYILFVTFFALPRIRPSRLTPLPFPCLDSPDRCQVPFLRISCAAGSSRCPFAKGLHHQQQPLYFHCLVNGWIFFTDNWSISPSYRSPLQVVAFAFRRLLLISRNALVLCLLAGRTISDVDKPNWAIFLRSIL